MKKITQITENTMFQYFVNVVSTEIGSEIGTYQYAVTEKVTFQKHKCLNHYAFNISKYVSSFSLEQ